MNANSNSTVSGLTFNQPSKELTFNVNGTLGTSGFCNITIPANLMSEPFSLFRDNVLLVNNVDYTQTSNGTHYTISINYNHSSHTIRIIGSTPIPESPQILAFAFAFLVTAILIGTTLLKKKNLKMN